MDEVQFTQFGKCEKCYMEDEEKIKDQIRELLDNLWTESLLEDFAFATTYNSVILSIFEILRPYFRGKK